ncbi:MAG: P-loop NTPase [Oscillospiraceae bacterium]|nr:P-loop NTPase [Oscillospiraceae bacterium]MDY2509553.1 P-loop NTPase [Ruminococcus callidus]
MEEQCNHQCESCGSNGSCSTQDAEHEKRVKENTSGVKNVIAVVGGKGGVGKSLVTSLLAIQTQRLGYHAAILDADITGPSIPKIFGISKPAEAAEHSLLPNVTESGLKIMSMNLLLPNATDPVLWRGPVISGVVKQFWEDVRWGDVDFLFVDMPPGTGDVPLTVFQSLPINGILIVSTPQSLVSMIVDKAMNMAQMMQVPVLGMVENMRFLRCPDCGKEIPLFGKDDHVDSHAVPVLERIPLDPNVAAACDAGTLETAEIDYLAKTAVMLTESFGKKQ